jgi:hypothetical protein
MLFRGLAIALIISCLVSCGSETPRQSADAAIETTGVSVKPIEGNVSADTLLPSFTLEMAETLVAKHYSGLNLEAKYPRYKGLLIRIETILPARGDSFDFTCTIHGRKWPTPNRDTGTLAFRTRESFTAYPQNRQWTAIRTTSVQN